MSTVMPNVTKKLKLEQQDSVEESRSLDRDSPIPLKNLGNTCYENSIIQCLFSLNMFMDNFEQSMETLRQHVVKKKLASYDVPNYFETRNQEQHKDQEEKSHNPEIKQQDDAASNATSLTENDVRYRIADAFDNLYKSYTRKRIQVESNNNQTKDNIHQQKDLNGVHMNNKQFNSSSPSSTETNTSASINNLAINEQPSTAIPLCKLTSADENNLQLQPYQQNETPSNSNETFIPPQPDLTPIALMSSASNPTTGAANEQSDIETRLEDLKSAVGERSSQFNSTHQQDASEFFYHVIDSIQEFYQSLDKIKDDDNPVTKAFELELDYLIRCPKCHHQVLSEPEKIRTLPLALPHVNTINNNETSASNQEYNHETNGAPTPPTSDLGLDSPESSSTYEEQRNNSDEKENQALVDESSSVAVVEDDSANTSISNNTVSIAKLDLTDKVEIGTNNQNQSQQKHYTLCDALNNYFKDDILECNCSQEGCDSKQKIKKCLIRKLPQVLFMTLARYSYTGKKNLDEIEAPFELFVPFRENKSPSHSPSAHNKFINDDHDEKYQLVAVVCHLGSSLNAGHYTSYVYNQNNFSWYSCDDDSITKVKEVDVKNDATKSGYCFFYAHNSFINQKPQNLDQAMELTEQQLHKTNENLIEAIGIVTSGVADSSVIMTPESSPKSSPTPSLKSIQEETAHTPQDHTSCMNQSDDIDDWS